MSSKQSSYRQIFKANTIFGGVQVINILISLVRGKVLAILIGTAGMGLNGLLMSNLNLIKIISGLGLEQSAVRDLSIAHGTGNDQTISRIYTIFKRWVWISAIIGIVVTISFSPLLSKFAFKDTTHTWSYIWLSTTFLFTALTGGIYTLLRGTRRIELLAKANVFGAVAGLVAVIPIFYFMKIRGVVPAIIVSSIVSYVISIYFKNKVSIKTTSIGWRETLAEGKGMVFLGISLSVSALFTSTSEYVLSIFITQNGSLSDLGVYNAGLSIINGYVGMIFTAIAIDFFPRLSAVINEKEKWEEIVFQQSELVMIILGPLLILLLATAPVLIRVLLSIEFTSAIDFIILSALAIPLKALIWVQGYIIIAKGQNKLFIITEVVASIFFLLISMLLFSLYSIKGLGISMIISYIFSLIMLRIVLKWKYDFSFNKSVIRLTAVFISLLILALLAVYLLGYPKAYLSGLVLFLIALGFSYHELNKRMDIKNLLITIKDRLL